MGRFYGLKGRIRRFSNFLVFMLVQISSVRIYTGKIRGMVLPRSQVRLVQSNNIREQKGYGDFMLNGRKIKKVVSAILCVTSLCCPAMIGTAFGGASDNGEVMPLYTAISATYTNITKNSNGSVHCTASTSVWTNNAGIKAELQQYKSGWSTIKTWTATEADYVLVEHDWYVEDGYSYRLKTTHYAYDANWNEIESVVKYKVL